MTPEQHEALCEHLMDSMQSPADCDHTLRRTTQWLSEASTRDAPAALAWLKKKGGYCDCEVLMNTMSMDEAPNAEIVRLDAAGGQSERMES